MLVLSRKLGQKLLIDGGIAITVLEIQGNRIRLGIEAPGHIGVLREELTSHAEPMVVEHAVVGTASRHPYHLQPDREERS